MLEVNSTCESASLGGEDDGVPIEEHLLEDIMMQVELEDNHNSAN